MSTAESVSRSPRSGSISHTLRHWAERSPEAIAVAAPGRAPLTYRALLARVEGVVATLNGFGIGRSDRVAVALPNGPDMAVAFLAVAAGATCAPLNPAYRAGELAVYLESLGAGALIVHPETEAAAESAAASLGIPVFRLSPRPEAAAGVFELTGGGASPAARSGFAGPDDVALVLHTSGTTARPKIVPLTQANLCASAENIRAALALAENDRCLNVMPLFHIHGLAGALLSSLAAGASVVCAPGFHATEFFAWLDEFRPTWYTAVPAMHQAVLARAAANREIIARAPLRLVRSCSSPLPPETAAALEQTFAAPVIDAYGMTEAAHQITSTPPGRRKAGSPGVAAGAEIAVIDDAGKHLAAGAEGEIAIRGAGVMRGYENAPEENLRAFADGWLRTGDLGRLDADGYLFITGRLKEIINRAGVKIAPAEIETALLAHPAVKEAAAFAAPHAELGEEPAAAVVLRDGAAAAEKEIREFAARRLADFKIPRRIAIVGEIPKTPTGKPRRAALAEKLAAEAPAPPASANAAPASELEKIVAEIWRRVLKIEALGVDDDFFRLGGDSILAARILSRVRETTQVELSFLVFLDAPTVAGMAKAIAAESAAAGVAPPNAGGA